MQGRGPGCTPRCRQNALRSWSRTVLCAVLSRVWLFLTSWTIARQTLLFMGILPARILQWVIMPFSRGSSQPRDGTQVSCIAGRFFTDWATRETQEWGTYPFSKGSSRPRNQTRVSCVAGGFFSSWAIRKAQDRAPVDSAWRAGRKGRKDTTGGLLRNTAHWQPCSILYFLLQLWPFLVGWWKQLWKLKVEVEKIHICHKISSHGLYWLEMYMHVKRKKKKPRCHANHQ